MPCTSGFAERDRDYPASPFATEYASTCLRFIYLPPMIFFCRRASDYQMRATLAQSDFGRAVAENISRSLTVDDMRYAEIAALIFSIATPFPLSANFQISERGRYGQLPVQDDSWLPAICDASLYDSRQAFCLRYAFRTDADDLIRAAFAPGAEAFGAWKYHASREHIRHFTSCIMPRARARLFSLVFLMRAFPGHGG